MLIRIDLEGGRVTEVTGFNPSEDWNAYVFDHDNVHVGESPIYEPEHVRLRPPTAVQAELAEAVAHLAWNAGPTEQEIEELPSWVFERLMNSPFRALLTPERE